MGDEWIGLIRNGIEGARRKYYKEGQESLFLWPFADYLMLGLQKPGYVTLVATKNKALLKPFSSLSAEDRYFLGISDLESEAKALLQFGNPHRLSAEKFPVRAGCDVLVAVSPLPGTRRRDYREFLRVIAKPFAGHLWQAINSLSERADGVGVSETGCVQQSAHREEEIEDPQTYLEPLRVEIGQVFDEIGGPLLRSKESDFPINLFTVVRQPCSTPRIIQPPRGKGRKESCYNYTASILLTSSQRDWLTRHRKDAKTLERPMGEHSRAIADSPSTSGVVDFSLPSERENKLWSRDYGPRAHPEEKKRSELESWLFGQPVPLEGKNYVIFYVPIHIGGLPWLEVFTMSKTRGSQMRHYFLYRDVIPHLGTALSTASQAAYSNILVSSVARNLGQHPDRQGFLDAVNGEWRRAAAWYPYPRLQLIAGESESDSKYSVELPDGSHCSLTSIPGPSPQVVFRMLDETSLKDRVIRGIKTAVADASATRSGITLALAHEFKNLTSPIVTATSVICNRIDNDPDRFTGDEDFKYFAERSRDLAFVVNKLAYAFHAEMVGAQQDFKAIEDSNQARRVLLAAVFLGAQRIPDRPVVFQGLPSLEECRQILSPYLHFLRPEANVGDFLEQSASLSILFGCLAEPIRNVRIVHAQSPEDRPIVTVTAATQGSRDLPFEVKLTQSQVEQRMLEDQQVQCRHTNLLPLRWLGGSCSVSIVRQIERQGGGYAVTIETLIRLPKVWRP